MKRPFQILLIALFTATQISASNDYPAGARRIALAGAGVALSDTWSTYHNQATLAGISDFSVGIYYESKFLIDELSLAAGTAVFPALGGSVGMSYRQLGHGTYKETKTGLAYARKLSERINAGVQFDYFANRFPENESILGFVTFELGMTFQPNNEIMLGLHAFNPVQEGFETNAWEQKMPAIFQVGGQYNFSENVILLAEVQKSTQQNLLVISGIEFAPLRNLAFRLGVSGAPWQVYGGLGYQFGRITTDIAFSYHGNLGFSPSVSLQFNLK